MTATFAEMVDCPVCGSRYNANRGADVARHVDCQLGAARVRMAASRHWRPRSLVHMAVSVPRKSTPRG